MNNQSWGILAALTLVLTAPLAADDSLDFHGYIRSGGAVNQDGHNASKDNNNGGVSSNLIGRLGNEDDTWVESEFVHKVTADDGVWTKMHVNFSASSANFALTTAPNLTLTQAYIEIGGLAIDPEATWFVGKRANREDIHILDFKWRNIDGAGIGLLGALGGALDVNLLTGDLTEGGTLSAVPMTLDVRYKLPFNLQLEGGAAWAPDASKKTGDATLASSGFQGAVVYYWDRFYGLPVGWMTVALQGGQGMFGARASAGANWNHLGQLGSIWTKQDSYALRAVTSGTGSFGDFDLAAGLWAEYDKQASTGDPYVVVAGALRPAWKATKNLSLVAEAGASERTGGAVSAATGTGLAQGMSYKFALAPTLALDSGVGARPQLRVFVSYIQQDKALGFVSADGTLDHELKFGVQAESWW